MQTYKKEGLSEAEGDLFCNEKRIFRRGIPKTLVVKSPIQITHLTCPSYDILGSICNDIIWKAVACGQQDCFANFCDNCIQNNGNQTTISDLAVCQESVQLTDRQCPKCSKKFLRTTIPLVNSLLSEIQFQCSYSASGCTENVTYDCFLKHSFACDYRRVSCEGCINLFLQKDLSEHRKVCSQIMVCCEKCFLKLPQSDFRSQHSELKCIELQLTSKSERLKNVEATVEQMKNRLNSFEMLIERIIKGETIPLNIQFYSSFPFNFLLSNSEAKLCKSSWNATKEKFDFLHFYVTSPIKTDSAVGFQWKLVVKVLRGNLLIGICSSLSTNSVDFVINRFGEIKKKQSTENKYKLIRKGNLIFSEGDVISFKYLALRKILKIQNDTKKVDSKLQMKQISQLGDNLYSFYSLDTINDCIKFI